MMTLQQVAGWLDPARLVGAEATAIGRVHTDTRSIEAGDLFVALQGERFDANAFLQEAQTRGAAAVICHAGLAASAYPAGLPRIEVPDTKRALAQLATGWRAQFELPLVAVTGSNGKTTVTQMVASILDAQAPNGAALATKGNFNNDIGVPLTLLRLRSQHRLAVVELGMNHPGEIAGLATMAQPTVALVNNAQREHLEFMHTVEAVARENGTVIAALPPQGVAVFPLDDDYTAIWTDLAGMRSTVQFGWTSAGAAQEVLCTGADWVDGAWQVRVSTPWGPLAYRLSIAGRHNVKNSLAAAACALAAGVNTQAVEQGLQAFVPVKGRCRAQLLTHSGLHCTLVDDTYNANPDSMRAAIQVLVDLPGPRLLVLGDMGEVGTRGAEFHAEVGRLAHASGITHVLALGELARHAVQACPGAEHFADVDTLIARARTLLPQMASVLVKGSRFMRMERVIEALAVPAGEGTSHVA
ncbi:UDP-N-acetylmuramoyl-tripeptide--D-alanyl-D-alanine ligase [uncultured Rhodoferax sp.]|uniref:UDP-N-acetylmuramoyl-tripeptide--D-alanyl-D- alanine ligase n=1 Tax=uncultured Rhodoferax sp. TaxID=223188 RepID=UPI0025E4DA6F|nr:UDP-N-acetylmuramoyl-tripeptide--D-alanyl-D-alanine ligase [uncultured Rhodoferax sp.]